MNISGYSTWARPFFLPLLSLSRIASTCAAAAAKSRRAAAPATPCPGPHRSAPAGAAPVVHVGPQPVRPRLTCLGPAGASQPAVLHSLAWLRLRLSVLGDVAAHVRF
jgi:hypothetical protein